MRKLKRIVLKNAHNFRDLGGYSTKDGKATKWHRLYRSDTLHNLSEEEWKYLYSNGLRMIVDLRSKAEADENKIKIPKDCKELVYKNCPVQSVNVDVDSNELSKFTLAESMAKAYIDMFNDDVKLFAKALTTIINGLEEKGQVVFMCTAGKDRTGVITALLLSLLKVYEEDIIADYQVSYTLNENGINAYLRTSKAVQFDEVKLESRPENMKELLNYFKEINVENVLIKNGLNVKNIEKLKMIFLESL